VKKSWLLLVGAAVGLTSCVVSGNVKVFTAFNLQTPKEACLVTIVPSAPSKRELQLSFNYSGPLKALTFSFRPNGATQDTVVAVPNLESEPVGFDINTLESNIAKLKVNLEQIQPTPPATAAIPEPAPKTSLPMDVKVDVFPDGSDSKITLELLNIDVANCYTPKPVPVANR
jgi:hypothetical protein